MGALEIECSVEMPLPAQNLETEKKLERTPPIWKKQVVKLVERPVFRST